MNLGTTMRARLPRSLWVYVCALIPLLIIFIVASSGQVQKSAAEDQSDVSSSSAGQMKLKRLWSYEWNRAEQCDLKKALCGLHSYFHCDYTSQTCQRGYRLDASTPFFLYVLLADDRKTAIAHLLCLEQGNYDEVCMSFDTGEVRWSWAPPNSTPEQRARVQSQNFTVPEDIPESCTLDQARPEDSCQWKWFAANMRHPLGTMLQILERTTSYAP